MNVCGSLQDTRVAEFGGLYTLLTSILKCIGFRVVLDITFAQVDDDFKIRFG